MTKESKLNIISTKDYNKFCFSEKNRDIVEKDVNNLISSMEEFGNTSIITCREVKEGYEILNGQHRLEALKRLGLEVHAHIIDNKEDVMIALNRNQSNWKPQDYLKYGVNSGIEDYIKLDLYYTKEYKVFSLIALIEVFGTESDNGSTYQFKKLNWKMEDEEMGKDILDTIQKLYHIYGFKSYNETKFVRAFSRLFQLEGFSCSRLMEKIKGCSSYLSQQASMSGYYQALNKIYNYNTQERGSKVDLVYMLSQRSNYRILRKLK